MNHPTIRSPMTAGRALRGYWRCALAGALAMTAAVVLNGWSVALLMPTATVALVAAGWCLRMWFDLGGPDA